jgi:chromatin remodeling complex protein RSC6
VWTLVISTSRSGSRQLATSVCNDCEWNASYNADFRTAHVLLEVIRRVFRFVEVNLTPNKRGSFGGYGIELDSALATVLGGREGQKISPSEMTKRIWAYVKHHNLGKKSN